MAQNTPAPAAGQKPKKVKKSATSGMSRALVRRETTSAYLFLLPSLIFFVTFVVVPMFICVYYSFTDYGLGGVKGFAGLSNYIKLFQDPIFHRGFLNTVLMVVVAVPSVTAFSLWVSSAIYKMHSIPRSFFRCVFYLPVATGPDFRIDRQSLRAAHRHKAARQGLRAARSAPLSLTRLYLRRLCGLCQSGLMRPPVVGMAYPDSIINTFALFSGAEVFIDRRGVKPSVHQLPKDDLRVAVLLKAQIAAFPEPVPLGGR